MNEKRRFAVLTIVRKYLFDAIVSNGPLGRWSKQLGEGVILKFLERNSSENVIVKAQFQIIGRQVTDRDFLLRTAMLNLQAASAEGETGGVDRT